MRPTRNCAISAWRCAVSNRARLTVTPGGPWRLYTHSQPGMDMLGTVQRGMEIGALARTRAGMLVQVNAGAVRSLDQRKVAELNLAAKKHLTLAP